jgi:hypothetical protein
MINRSAGTIDLDLGLGVRSLLQQHDDFHGRPRGYFVRGRRLAAAWG